MCSRHDGEYPFYKIVELLQDVHELQHVTMLSGFEFVSLSICESFIIHIRIYVILNAKYESVL